MLGLIAILVTFHDWWTHFLPPDSAQVPSLLYDSRLLKVFWVAVKELKVTYHNVYIYIYEIVGFPQHSNLYQVTLYVSIYSYIITPLYTLIIVT